MATSTSLVYNVNTHLDKLNEVDADYRFMAFSDLTVLLTNPDNKKLFISDKELTDRILKGVIKALDDPVADVQSQAVKCLEPLMPVLVEGQVNDIMNLLSERFKGSPEGSSITYMALRTAICQSNATPGVASVLGNHLIPILHAEKEWNIDSLDVLTDYLKRFGNSVSANDIAKIEKHVLEIISKGKGIVRKRAVTALGYLSRYLTATRWNSLISYIHEGLSQPQDQATTQTLVFLTGTLAKSEPKRFREQFRQLFPLVIKALATDALEQQDEDEEEQGLLETREAVMSTLEAFVGLGQCVEEKLEDIVSTIATFIKYDPNYNETDDDDVDMEGEGYDSEDEFGMSDGEGFSEDEDQSWKLRKYSCRLATAVVNNCSTQLPFIYSNLLALIVKRVGSEREPSVTVDVLATLSEFIKAAAGDAGYYTSKLYNRRRSSDASMALDSDPQAKLESVYPQIIKMAERECSKTSTSPGILHGYMDTIHSLVTVLEFDSPEPINVIIKVLEGLTSDKSQMMVDILKTVQALFKKQQLENLDCDRLFDLIIKGITDNYYKVSGEGLDVAYDVLEVFINNASSFPGAKLDSLESSILEKATSSGQDLETRERAIKALARLLALSGTTTPESLNKGFKVVFELIGNDMLRIPAINAAETLAKFVGAIDTSSVKKTLDLLCLYLKQSSKNLRLNTLSAIRAFTSQGAGDDAVVGPTLIHGINSLEATDYDAQVVNLTAGILGDLCKVVPDKSQIANFTLKALDKPECDQSAEPLLYLVSSLSQSLDDAQRKGLYQSLATTFKDSPIGSQAIAALIANGQPDLVKFYEQNIENGTDVKKSLVVLGYVGLNSTVGINLDIIVNQFNSSDEAIQMAAGQAVGEITTNHLEHLNSLIQGLQNPEKAAIYLTSIREVVVSDKLQQLPTETVETIWNSLFNLRIEGDSAMTKIAECVGRLSILNPEQCLPQLQNSLKSKDWTTRTIALSAVKYSFGQSHDTYDNFLRPIVIDFVALVEDEDLKIRQVAMSTLVAAIHNKPYLLVPHLSLLLPSLYKETVVNTDLIRTVRVGPFKHKQDDGLELRKTAYEAIYNLVTTLTPDMLNNYVDLGQLFERVLDGLKDEHDIKVLCCVIVGHMAQINFSVLASSAPRQECEVGGINNVTALFSGMINVTIKDNAMKTEFEKHDEVKRNVWRASVIINKTIGELEEGRGGSGLTDVERSNWIKFFSTLNEAVKYK